MHRNAVKITMTNENFVTRTRFRFQIHFDIATHFNSN